MSGKKQKKIREEENFNNTPLAVYMTSMQDFLVVSQRMHEDNPDDKIVTERYEGALQAYNAFVEIVKNKEFLSAYDFESTDILLAAFDRLSESNRNMLLVCFQMYLEMIDNTLTENKDKNIPQELYELYRNQIAVFNDLNDFYLKVDLGPETYKNFLRSLCNDAIERADTFINNADKDNEQTAFGYEYKNNSLIFRTKLKSIKADANDFKFVEEFLSVLSEDEKEFFLSNLLKGFIDICEIEFAEGKPHMAKQEELLALAKQVNRKLD